MTKNLKKLIRDNLSDIGGSLGDLGILLPLAILLIVGNGLSAVTVFCFVGLHYLITGYYFKIPLPIQPLKATAIIAIAIGASPELIAATGILMGLILLFMTIGRLTNLLGRVFTKPVVRGIQLAVGLFLVQKGIALISGPPEAFQNASHLITGTWISDTGLSVVIAAVAGLTILGFSVYRKIPATLILLPVGILFGLLFTANEQLPNLNGQLTLPALITPSWDDFLTAFILMVIPQLPLTFANSIVSTHHIAKDYYGDHATRVTPKALCTSLGFGNLLGGFFGAIPCCHGAGGLTAHYSFGARTGKATIFLGLMFMTTGLLFGESVYHLFTLVPAAVLGTLLIYVGIEHCMMIKDVLPYRQAAFVTLIIGGISIATHNIAIGFVVGMVIGLLIKIFPTMVEHSSKH